MVRHPSWVKYLCVAFSFIFLTGCPGVADYDLDLPGNYSVVRISAHDVNISPKREFGYGPPVIRAKVTEVAWDDTYIITKQVSLKPDPKSSNGYRIPDENNYRYWIIEFETGKLIGPLDDLGLAEKRAELQIADDVELKNPREYLGK